MNYFIGTHYQKKGTDMNEYTMGRQNSGWHARDGRQISFIVTQNCNLRCKYCYMVNKNDEHKMTFQVAKDAIDFFLDHQDELFNTDYIILDFIGGEPLMEIDLIDEITDYFKLEVYRRNNKWFGKYRISISTNGLLYSDPKVQRYIKKNKENLSIGISIDGTKDKHNLQRVYPDGTGSYDDVERNVKLWVKQYPEAHTKVTIGHDDLKFIKDSIIHLWNLGIKTVPANTIFENVWKSGDEKIFESQLKELADYIIEHKLWNEYNTTLFSEDIGFKQTEEELNKNFCGAGQAYALDSLGNLYPCIRYVGYSLENKNAIKFGNIYDGLQSDRMRPFKILTAKVQSPKQCIECPVSTGCAYCQAQNYDSSIHNTNFERALFSCEMHKARVRANNYYWAKLYNKFGIQRDKDGIKRHFERQMYFMLGDKCAKLCSNYTIGDSKCLMSKEVILQGLEKASQEFYQPYFLHSQNENVISIFGDLELQKKLEEHIIKHIVPYSVAIGTDLLDFIKISDVIFTVCGQDIDIIQNTDVRNCILLINHNEIINIGKWVEKIIPYFERINLKCDLTNITELKIYEEQLHIIETVLLNQYRNGHFCEFSVLTDKLYMDDMDNCYAGEKNVSLAPDGNYYTCPAFYYQNEKQKVEYTMTKIEHSPICRECDAYQCERCVFLNKERTLEYNIPSELQCLKAHAERKITIHLQEELSSQFPELKTQHIKSVNYDDPCAKVIQMWNLV